MDIERFLTHPKTRGGLAFTVLFGVSLLAGWAIFMGEKKLLAVLGLVTLHLFLRRWHFSDFYLLTLACAALSHVHFAAVQDEFERDKWLALFAMAGVAVVTMLMKWRSRPWPGLIHVPVLVLLGFVVWSVSWSLRPWLSFQKAGVFGLGVLIAFGGASAYASGAKQVRKILDAQVDLLWMVFPLSVLVWALPFPGKYAGAGRFRAIFGNANALGVWASMTLPLVFALMLTHPRLIRRRISGIMLVTGVFVAFLTGSRGGVGGAIIGIGLYSLLRWPRRNVALAVAGSIFVFFIFAYEFDLGYVSDKIEHLVRPKTLTTLSDRTIAWEAAIFVGNQSPWQGHGFGLEDILYAEFGQSFVGTSATAVHSTYLATYMTLGKIGTGLLILVIAASTLMGLDAWRKDKKGEEGLLALALACGVLSGAAHGVVENIFFALGNPWSLPYWTVMALSARLWTLQGRRLREERKARTLAAERERVRPRLESPTRAAVGVTVGSVLADLFAGRRVETEPPAWVDWVRSRRLAAEVAALGDEALSGLTRETRRALAVERERVRAAAVTRAPALARAGRALAEAGIPAWLYKGEGFIRLTHGDASRRPMADLDLVVERQAQDRACRALVGAGFTETAHATALHDVLIDERAKGPGYPHGVALELHGDVFPPPHPFELDLGGVLARSRPSELPGLRLPTPEDALVLHAFHLLFFEQDARKGQLGLRDLALLEAKCDRGQLRLRAEAAGMTPVLRALLERAAPSATPIGWGQPRPANWRRRLAMSLTLRELDDSLLDESFEPPLRVLSRRLVAALWQPRLSDCVRALGRGVSGTLGSAGRFKRYAGALRR